MSGARMTLALMLTSILMALSWSQVGLVKVAASRPNGQYLPTVAPGWSVISVPLSPPARLSAISHHAPWKIRRKAVLETNPQIREECDLGPVLVPNRPLNVVPVEALARPLSSGHPLRC
jgi:hypothetical protein